jgi:two-component system LytT family response regulator
MKAIIIDDERLARQELKNMLAPYPELEVVAECNNAETALKAIKEYDPDLLFLDIQMPGKNGFDLLQETDVTTVLDEQDQVFVKDGERCWFVKLSDIRLFESEGNYVRVYFDKNRPLILRSLNYLDERLNPKIFFRASRKHIINLKWVENIENWFNGGLMVQIKGGEKVEISRRQAAKFKDIMSL